MADKRTVCLKLDAVYDKDIIKALDESYNRTQFIRMCIRGYLSALKIQEDERLDESPYYD